MKLSTILGIVRDSLYGIIACIALIYSCLIIFLRRFHHRNNAFILNLCINTIFTCLYFIIYFNAGSYFLSPAECIFFHYAFNVASVELAYAFLAFSIYRFCSVVYHNRPLFKTKKWIVICISSQWIGQFVISLPFFFEKYTVNDLFIE